MVSCLFCKIINQQIPSTIIYQDEDVCAFKDINPVAEVHFLIIPKQHIESMLNLKNEHQTLMGKIMLLANHLAQEHGLTNGYKIQINSGINGGQEVFHLHVHVFGQRG